MSKTQSMVCTRRLISGQQGVEAYNQRATGEGPTFQESKRTRVSCEECGVKMDSSSLQHHTESSHGMVLPQIMGVDVGGGGMYTYKVLMQRNLKLVECTVEVCAARANITGRLREHFMY